MSISLLVLLGVYQVYDTSQVTFQRGLVKASVQQEAREALERMRRELRMAGYDPSGTGQAAVQNPTSTSVFFIADPDEDNTSDLISYDRDATTKTLRRSVRRWVVGTGWGAATVTTVAGDVEALTFAYLPSAALPGLSRIQVTLQTSGALPRQPTQQQQLVTEVFLRNL